MPVSTPESTSARHRAPGSARTPVDDAVLITRRHLTTAGRVGAAAAGTSGLLVSMLATPALASPSTDQASLPTVDTSALTATARAALEVSPPVQVAVDASWTFDVPDLQIVADPPPPPPAPEARPSRAAARVPAPQVEPAPASLGAPAPASANGSAIVEIAARYVGSPYLWGGTTPDGFDCSGFTSYVFAQVGITLPRTSSEQRYAGTVVPADQAMPGDLIWTPGHVAIYAGGNLQVDSPLPGGTVQIREIYQSDPTFIRVG